jgi:hypothetical protein
MQQIGGVMDKKAAEVPRKRAARKGRKVDEKVGPSHEALQNRWSRMMSEPEVAFLRDVQGFIDYAIRNGMIFASVVGTLLNDLNEITRDGFNYDKALSRGFEPEVSRYAHITSEDFGESDEDFGPEVTRRKYS